MTNTKSTPTAQAVCPHVTDIARAYQDVLEAERVAATDLETVEQRWITCGGMLIAVRVREKGKFGKWLKANQATLGFGRSRAYQMMSFVRNDDALSTAGACLNNHRGGASGYISIERDREGAAARARKSRDKLKERIAELEAWEKAEREKQRAAELKRWEAKQAEYEAKRQAERTAPPPNEVDELDEPLPPPSNNVVNLDDARPSSGASDSDWHEAQLTAAIDEHWRYMNPTSRTRVTAYLLNKTNARAAS